MIPAIFGIRRFMKLIALAVIFNTGISHFAFAIGPGANWQYYRPINLSIPIPDSNFQVKLTLTSGQYTGMKSDGSDLRFCDNAGNNCEYWIENWNTQGTSTIWVKVVNSGTDILLMYYGYKLANEVSNGNTTFDFFDDFTAALNDNWTTSGSVTQSGSVVTLANTNGITAASLSNTNAFTPSSSSFFLETKHYEVGYNRNRFYATTSTGGGSPITLGDYGYFSYQSTSQLIAQVFWGTFPSKTTMSNNINYLTQWSITDGSIYNWYTYDYSTGNLVLNGSRKTTCSSTIRYISISVTDVANTSSIIDWIRVRKGSDTEPVGTAGNQYANTILTTPALFTNSGYFIVPDGVNSITVDCLGGGGGGSTITSNGGGRGGGGGGGALANSSITVTPGMIFPFTVGTGGTANTNGGTTSFNTSVVVADGGKGAPINSTTAGAGGTTALSTGTIKYAGGNGADGGSVYSGGGGGGAGTTGAGGNAPTAAPGSFGTGNTFYGGNGGASVSGSTNGNKGNNYGGGGSGACTNTGTDKGGGPGANGLVVISWCIPPAAPTVTSPVTCCQNVPESPLTATGSGLLWYATPTGGIGSSTAPTPSTISAGITSFYVSQTIGCESPRAQIEVIVNPSPSASVTAQTNISCFDEEDGTITIQANGGTVPYSYSVDNGKTWKSSTINPYVYDGLKADTPYQIRVKDSNGCESPEIP